MLTRIRNSARVMRKNVTMPSSKLKVGIAEALKAEGYINGYDVIEDNKQSLLRIDLKYGPRGEVVLQDIQRVSKPGCRIYRSVDKLPRVLDGLGVSIVSTSRGVLSDRLCREQNLGGEVLCTVY